MTALKPITETGRLRMDKRVKTMWVEALESGEYDQCQMRLMSRRKDGYGFCCLGVLTNLYCLETGRSFRGVAKDFSALPAEVATWAGLDGGWFRNNVDPFIAYDPDSGMTVRASRVNDECEADFAEIARLIKRSL